MLLNSGLLDALGSSHRKDSDAALKSPVRYLEVQGSYEGSLYGIYYMVYIIWYRM